MKMLPIGSLTVLLLFAGLSGAQTIIQKPATRAPGDSAAWSQMGEPVSGPFGFTLFTRGIRAEAQSRYAVWIRVVPQDEAEFARKFSLPAGVAEIVQFVHVDCRERTLFFEESRLFGKKGEVFSTKGTLVPMNRSRVREGSISEAVFRNICDEPGSGR